jgi:hypothetical protein
MAVATLPNVCKMPPVAVPLPQPNIGMSMLMPQGYSTTVKIECMPVAVQGASCGSVGDIASLPFGGGIVSNIAHGLTKFIGPGAISVRIEGRSVHVLGDPTLNNCAFSGAPPNAGTLPGILQVPFLGPPL